MKGYVYVLTNEAMPGLVKIGRSKYGGDGRAKAIYKGDTGVPLPFEVYFECLFDDCIDGELVVHEELNEFRINQNREFFKMDAEDASMVVMRARAYNANHTVVESDLTVDESNIAVIARDLGRHMAEVATAMSLMQAEEVRPAMDRWDERMERLRIELQNGGHKLSVVENQ